MSPDEVWNVSVPLRVVDGVALEWRPDLEAWQVVEHDPEQERAEREEAQA